MHMDVCQRARLCVYLEAVCGFQSFMGPILVIFYLQYMGLSMAQFLFLDGLLFAILALCEIPSGYLSDRLGRKRMVLLSKTMELFAMALLLFGKSYLFALLATILNGLFGALESGNTDSMYYETFQAHNQMDLYRTTIQKASTIGFLSATIASIVAGFCARIALYLPLLLDMLACSIVILGISFCLIDHNNDQHPSSLSILQDLNDHKAIVRGLLPAFFRLSCLFAFFRLSYSLYQPILQTSGISLVYFGLIFALGNLISSFASTLYQKTSVLKAGFLGLVALGSVVGLVFTHGAIVVVWLYVQQFLRGFAMPYIRMHIQEVIPSQSFLRTTLTSVSNAMDKLVVTILSWLLSFLVTHSLALGYLIVMAILGIFLLTIKEKVQEIPAP